MIDERLARGTEFNRYDRRFISWATREPAQRGNAPGFDREREIARFEQMRDCHWYEEERFFEQRAAGMTLPEARFWLYARTGEEQHVSGGMHLQKRSREAADRELRSVDLNRTIDCKTAAFRLEYSRTPRSLLLPLGRLFRCDELLALMRSVNAVFRSAFADGMARFVVPYLDAAEFAALQAAAVPVIERFIEERSHAARRPATTTPNALRTHREWAKATPPEIALCPALHLPDLTSKVFELLIGRSVTSLAVIESLVLGHASPAEVRAAGAQARLRLVDSGAVRGWLAATGEPGLTHARRFFNDRDDDDLAARIEALGMLRSAGAARAMLDVTLRKGADAPARAWLAANLEVALPVLAQAAAGRSRAGDVAVQLLRSCAGNSDEADLAQRLPPDVRAVVFGTPAATAGLDWLDDVPKRAKPVAWLYADALPELPLPGRTLSEDKVPAIVEVLRAGTLTAIEPRLAALRAVIDPISAERWALALFRQWLRANAPIADRWAMFALGWFGGDETVLALVPMIRRWPGEAQHARAVVGLEILRIIGTDLALTQIAGLAQRLPFAALKARAKQCIEELALARHLSRERLEDRIVPTLDFEPSGERPLSFRGSSYRVRLGSDLAPKLFDPLGRATRDLPKALADDPDVTSERAEWTTLKKQLRELATLQRRRLEAAMVAQRAWFADDFQLFIVDHPIVGKLARALVWVVDSIAGVSRRFSIETRGFVDVDGDQIALPISCAIRVAHRLDLDENELEYWDARFAGRPQPFRQLDRVTYRLDPAELRETAITRFGGSSVAQATFINRLKQRAWQHGPPADGGMYDLHTKYFARANVHAVISHNGIVIGFRDPNARVAQIDCSFYRDVIDSVLSNRDRLTLADVDGVAVSEVVADLAYVVGG